MGEKLTSSNRLEESSSTKNSAQAPESGTAAPGTVTDTAANLHVTSLPKASSTRKTYSSLAIITTLGSTQHSTTFTGTGLDTPSSPYLARVTEFSTSVQTLSSVDTTTSYLIATSSDDQHLITSFLENSGISQSPQNPKLTTFHVSLASY